MRSRSLWITDVTDLVKVKVLTETVESGGKVRAGEFATSTSEWPRFRQKIVQIGVFPVFFREFFRSYQGRNAKAGGKVIEALRNTNQQKAVN